MRTITLTHKFYNCNVFCWILRCTKCTTNGRDVSVPFLLLMALKLSLRFLISFTHVHLWKGETNLYIVHTTFFTYVSHKFRNHIFIYIRHILIENSSELYAYLVRWAKLDKLPPSSPFSSRSFTYFVFFIIFMYISPGNLEETISSILFVRFQGFSLKLLEFRKGTFYVPFPCYLMNQIFI